VRHNSALIRNEQAMKQRKAPNSPLALLPIDSVWDGKYRVVAQLGEVPMCTIVASLSQQKSKNLNIYGLLQAI
jgi:hypothetical protein